MVRVIIDIVQELPSDHVTVTMQRQLDKETHTVRENRMAKAILESYRETFNAASARVVDE